MNVMELNEWSVWVINGVNGEQMADHWLMGWGNGWSSGMEQVEHESGGEGGIQ